MRRLLLIIATLVAALPAHAQVFLTGAIQFSTNSLGAAAGGQVWNTLAGDHLWDLWLAQNPDASSPINGPADANAGILIPLVVGHVHTFYIFGSVGTLNEPYNGLNLFFDGYQYGSRHLRFRSAERHGLCAECKHHHDTGRRIHSRIGPQLLHRR